MDIGTSMAGRRPITARSDLCIVRALEPARTALLKYMQEEITRPDEPTGKPKPPLMYWGKYVAHDNNRDGMGQYLKLTQNITKAVLDWHPTVLHDLHEAQSLSLCIHRHRSLQRFARSDRNRRVVAAGRNRSHGDGQAQCSRRLHLWLLRWMGAQLSLLDRHHA